MLIRIIVHLFSHQLLLENKATNESVSGQALVSPAPPSYEEATTSKIASYPQKFNCEVILLSFANTFNKKSSQIHVLGWCGSDVIT